MHEFSLSEPRSPNANSPTRDAAKRREPAKSRNLGMGFSHARDALTADEILERAAVFLTVWSGFAANATQCWPQPPRQTGARLAVGRCWSGQYIPSCRTLRRPKWIIAALFCRADMRWAGLLRRNKNGAAIPFNGSQGFVSRPTASAQPRLPLIERPKPIRIQFQRAGHMKRVERADSQHRPVLHGEVGSEIPNLQRQRNLPQNASSNNRSRRLPTLIELPLREFADEKPESRENGQAQLD